MGRQNQTDRRWAGLPRPLANRSHRSDRPDAGDQQQPKPQTQQPALLALHSPPSHSPPEGDKSTAIPRATNPAAGRAPERQIAAATAPARAAVRIGAADLVGRDSATMMSSSSPPPPALPAGGGSFFRGYTKLCKGLAVVLLLVHLLVQLFPSALAYLALIPSRTIPFAWNLITAAYVEQTIPGVIISIIGLLLFGKLLEPLWGSKELSKFIFVVNFSTSACVFITAIASYYITQQESYLYTPLSGFYGVLSGLLVGIKQLLPDQELNLFVLKIKGKWIPSLVALISVAVSFFVKQLVSYIPFLLFGIYMSWIYLRYFQKRLESGLKGDPSDEFSFSSFFPEFLRPILDPIASIFHRLLCGRSEKSDSRDQALDTSSLPGSDSIEANRRRERGQRALEQRLAEKLAAVRSSEGTSLKAADKV